MRIASGTARRAAVLVVLGLLLAAVSAATVAWTLRVSRSAAANAATYRVPALPLLSPNEPRITVPADPRLLIVGDSYTYGSGASVPTKGYAYRVAAQLGWTDRIDGVPGTGFTYPGLSGVDQRYTTRIARLVASRDFTPNVVVLEGGQNDYRAKPADLTAAVVATVQQLRRAYPGVQVVVFGPVAPEPLFGQLGDIDSAMSLGSSEAQVPYISPFQEQWIDASNSARFQYDSAHLNDLGQIDISSRFLIDFQAVGG